ncbi:MAG TPA: Uma2 family endonuclease [Thermoanaerobaculia bacterium]|nr:Uma2 family endonuclease [Thermoanaerobaculia bacterium]
MAAKTIERPATYDDLLRVPDHLVAEIVEGELITSPRPATPHARAVGQLFAWASRNFDEGDGGPGGWWIVFEPELHLGRDVLVPDIAGWRRETLPVFPDVPAMTVAPDWVCEAISHSTERLDRYRKLPIYARNRIEYAWILNPLAWGLEVYKLLDDRYTLMATCEGEDIARAEPFEACELPLSRLWLTPPPPQS